MNERTKWRWEWLRKKNKGTEKNIINRITQKKRTHNNNSNKSNKNKQGEKTAKRNRAIDANATIFTYDIILLNECFDENPWRMLDCQLFWKREKLKTRQRHRQRRKQQQQRMEEKTHHYLFQSIERVVSFLIPLLSTTTHSIAYECGCECEFWIRKQT